MKNFQVYYFLFLTVFFTACKNNTTSRDVDPIDISSEEINVETNTFEGIISFDSFNEFTGKTSGKYFVKGNRIRIELEDLDPSIFVPEKDLMIGIMLDERRYMEIDLKKVYTDKTSQKENITLEKTGKTKEIAGYTCEIWNITTTDGTTSAVCMAKGLADFISPANPLSTLDNEEWEKQIGDGKYIQLEVITDLYGTEQMSMKATKIEEKKLNDSLFKVPNGFTKLSSILDRMNNLKDNSK